MVLQYIKKGFRLGLRAAHISEREARQFAKEIVAAGIITAREGEAFAKEMLVSGKKHGTNVKTALKKKIGPRMKRYGAAVKSKIKSIRRKR